MPFYLHQIGIFLLSLFLSVGYAEPVFSQSPNSKSQMRRSSASCSRSPYYEELVDEKELEEHLGSLTKSYEIITVIYSLLGETDKALEAHDKAIELSNRQKS